MWCGCRTRLVENKVHRCILDHLEESDGDCRSSSQKRVIIVESRDTHCLDEELCSPWENVQSLVCHREWTCRTYVIVQTITWALSQKPQATASSIVFTKHTLTVWCVWCHIIRMWFQDRCISLGLVTNLWRTCLCTVCSKASFWFTQQFIRKWDTAVGPHRLKRQKHRLCLVVLHCRPHFITNAQWNRDNDQTVTCPSHSSFPLCHLYLMGLCWQKLT